MTATIHHGDCLDVLRSMPDNSVHAIVTDPPYGLSNTTPEQVADTIVRWVSGEREYLPSGRGFMGKEWDGFVPPVAVWDEAMRVLKPGGHVLAFAGTRTMDLMTLGLRLAGFDIRDSVAWLYGSGFPKSMDISKAIDKARDEDAEPRRAVARALRDALESSGKTRREIDQHFGTANVSQYWFSPDRNTQTPPADKWPWLRDFLNIGPGLDAEVWRLNGRKGQPGENWGKREVVGKSAHKSGIGNGTSGHYTVGGTKAEAYDITAPATDAAKQWHGWGSATKPAFEPVIMARKPFRGTLAANVLEHGTGGLNIDACRIAGDMSTGTWGGKQKTSIGYGGTEVTEYRTQQNPSGRWPANVILDEHMAGVLDRQSGPLHTQNPETRKSRSKKVGATEFGTGRSIEYADEKGTGASRFFYVAKAPKRERPSYVNEGGQKVAHPTTKPLTLMKYLVRLVTPPNGIVLDPFAGSGTTIEAAMLEGFQVIGIEREAEYLPLIRHRIDRAQEHIRTEQQAQAEAPEQGAFAFKEIA